MHLFLSLLLAFVPSSTSFFPLLHCCILFRASGPPLLSVYLSTYSPLPFPVHLHRHFADFPKTAALRTIILNHALAPDIAVFLDLQALLRVRRLAKESRLYQRQLCSEIATEITRRKVEQDKIEKEEELELAMRIEDEAAELFEANFPGASWERMEAGYYPQAFFPPPLYWIGLARRRHETRARLGRPCAMTEELHRIGGI